MVKYTSYSPVERKDFYLSGKGKSITLDRITGEMTGGQNQVVISGGNNGITLLNKGSCHLQVNFMDIAKGTTTVLSDEQTAKCLLEQPGDYIDLTYYII